MYELKPIFNHTKEAYPITEASFYIVQSGTKQLKTKICYELPFRPKADSTKRAWNCSPKRAYRSKKANAKLLTRCDDFPLEVLYLRDDDIPQAVSMGVADVGIVGLNEVEEKGST